MQDISKFKYEEGKMETRGKKTPFNFNALKEKKNVFCYTHKAFIQTRFNLSNETRTVS